MLVGKTRGLLSRKSLPLSILLINYPLDNFPTEIITGGGGRVPIVVNGEGLSAMPIPGELPDLTFRMQGMGTWKIGFEKLQGLKNLEHLDLTFNNFSNNILSSLSGLSSLRSLSIGINRLKGSIYFEEFNNLKNLKELFMDGNEIEELIFFRGGKLRLNNLETLSLNYNRFNNNVLSLLDNLWKLAAFGNLEYLSLSGNKNITKFVTSKDFRGLTNLNTLDISYMSSNGMSFLLKSLAVLPYIKTLYLKDNNLTESTLYHEFQSLKNLENLDLKGSVVDENFTVSLTAMPSLKNLLYTDGSGLNNLQGLCNLIHLQSLDLSYSNLRGGLPHCLANLSSLQYLDLSGNSLEGDLSSSPLGLMTHLQYLHLGLNYFRFTESEPFSALQLQGLCNLAHLQSLYLRSNNLNGTLPWCLANLTSLQYLDLSYNSLVGNLSSSPLTLMTSIQDLIIDGNYFQIPISLFPFYNFSNLKRIVGTADNDQLYADTVSHNSIPKFQLEELRLTCDGCGGSFPRFFYHQHNLQYTFLPNIKISGGFPYWLLENNTSLELLDLSNNSLSGPIRLSHYPHRTLLRLDISTNSFDGQIPTEFGSYFPNLSDLNMSNNNFDGSIPPSFGNLRWLFDLDLSNNDFSGSIPPSFGNLRYLNELDLSNNQLSDELPRNLTMGCLELRYLKLSNNSLEGQIFSDNMNLKELIYIELGGNQFVGTIPDSLCGCSALEILYVNGNHLSGEIPDCIGSMQVLQVLDLSGNNLTGSIPMFWRASQLREVYLSRNRLHGSFARAFSNSPQLMILDLSRNFLKDNFSKWNGNFPQLRLLLLGHNNIEGEIPSEVCILDQLNFIDLSNNDLSGHIPHFLMYKKWHKGHGGTSYPPNPAPVPELSHTVYAPPRRAQPQPRPVEITTKNISLSYKGKILTLMSGINLSWNNLTGHIPPELGYLNQIKMLNLSHNTLTGPIPPTFSGLAQIESLDLSYNNLGGRIPPQFTQLPFISSFSVAHNNLSGRTPDRIKQFGTFNNDSYEGNPFLCGDPLSRSCTQQPPLVVPRTSRSKEEESGFIDKGVFYVSFTVTYTIVLSGIAAILYINPYWRRAWFYFIEVKMEDCYYFIVYDCSRFFKFRA